MFSKKERDFLSINCNLSKNYEYVLEHRIKQKLQQYYKLELPLIEKNQNITEFHKNLTECYKLRTGSEPVTFTLPKCRSVTTRSSKQKKYFQLKLKKFVR